MSGSGNNWACGYFNYGRRYGDQLREAVRTAAEQCDCLQSFLLLHSMGGGTGSGLGTWTLEMLADEFPDVYRFATPVYPSEVGKACLGWMACLGCWQRDGEQGKAMHAWLVAGGEVGLEVVIESP